MFNFVKPTLISGSILLLISLIWSSVIFWTPKEERYETIGNVVDNKITIYRIKDLKHNENHKLSFVFSYKYKDDLGSHVVLVPFSENLRDNYVIEEKYKDDLPYELCVLLKEKKVIRYKTEYSYFFPILIGFIGLPLCIIGAFLLWLIQEPKKCRNCKVKDTCIKYAKP